MSDKKVIEEASSSSLIPGEWIAKKVLGPVLDEIGLDLSKLYKKGVKKIGDPKAPDL